MTLVYKSGSSEMEFELRDGHAFLTALLAPMNVPLACLWFATCPNLATGAIAHPVLGDVPVCESCAMLAGGHQ